MKILALAFLALSLRADELSKNLKDSQEVHALLGRSRSIQAKIDRATKRFAERNHCPTGNSTLDGLGFLVCTPPPPQPAPPKTEDKK